MITTITDFFTGKAPLGMSRSKGWAGLRREHLLTNPTCAVCDGFLALAVHHIKPFHTHPELELDPTNLLTLCEHKKYGINCHLLIGHLGSYRRINPDVHADVATWHRKIRP